MNIFKIAGFSISDALGVQSKGKVVVRAKKWTKKSKKRNGKKVDKAGNRIR